MTQPPLTLDDLDRLTAAGELSAGSGYELVAGVLLAASPPSAEVVVAVTDLAAALDAVARDHHVVVREALVLGPLDLLRPEVAVLRPAWPPRARSARPSGAAVALAVFVGEDEAPLRWRAHRCARGGVRETWTLALGERRGSRWRLSLDGRYQRRDAIVPGEVLAPDAFPDLAVQAWRP